MGSIPRGEEKRCYFFRLIILHSEEGKLVSLATLDLDVHTEYADREEVLFIAVQAGRVFVSLSAIGLHLFVNVKVLDILRKFIRKEKDIVNHSSILILSLQINTIKVAELSSKVALVKSDPIQ